MCDRTPVCGTTSVPNSFVIAALHSWLNASTSSAVVPTRPSFRPSQIFTMRPILSAISPPSAGSATVTSRNMFSGSTLMTMFSRSYHGGSSTDSPQMPARPTHAQRSNPSRYERDTRSNRSAIEGQTTSKNTEPDGHHIRDIAVVMSSTPHSENHDGLRGRGHTVRAARHSRHGGRAHPRRKEEPWPMTSHLM